MSVHRKVVKISHRDEAEYYREESLEQIETIKKDLGRLCELATYNAEMEDYRIRETEAYDLCDHIEYLLDKIDLNVAQIAYYVK